MLRKFYDWMLSFADHPRAIWVLSAVSFAESSFFPIPPDPLYIAMLLSNRDKVWKLAFICTITSVLGGLLGYAIGYSLYETLGEWILHTYGLQAAFDKFQHSFNQWGFWIVALKGLTPIPYKVVTIACGLTGLDIFKFMLASVIARGFRFFMLATLFWYYGPSIKTYIDENLTLVTFVALAALVGGFGIIYAIG
ncbi:DedA family protein [Candidatus Bealeia paramacronuclearis]|uniref:DedA family protein n=1 Tax=Candidatus Bealeia paramacronuclearis TaxID=1921001 RepID=A0ABZ2C5E9_9PROT|nr:DedA family protein [Candidatus Bealeia paramacronuclearis]